MGKSSKNNSKNNSDRKNVKETTKKAIKTNKKRKIDEQTKNVKKIAKDEKNEELTSSVNETPAINLPSEKNFTCQICCNKFSSHKELIQHFQEHGRKRSKYDKPTQCDTCTMIFANQTKAIQHRHRAHPNVPNSFCQFCGKLFVLKNSLEEHLTKDHPNQLSPEFDSLINCDYCTATFSNATALQYHVKSLHQQINYLLASDLYIPPSSTKIIRSNSSELFSAYYCHLCGIEYMIKNGLKKHLYEMHTPEERNTSPENCIKCKTCEAIFVSKFAYDKHLVFHKPGDLYAANQEERIKVVSRVDQDFDISRVPLLQEINTMLKQMAENPILPNEMKSESLTPAVETKIETNTLQIKVVPNSSIDFAKEENPHLIHKKDAINLKLDSPVTASSSKLSTIDESTHSGMNTSIKLKKTYPAAPNSNKLKKTKNSNVTRLENLEHKSVETLIKTEILDNETKISNSNKNISTSSCAEATKNRLTKCSDTNTIPKFSKTANVVIKSKPNSTMEIVDSQNKVIVLKKVVLKKKPMVKVKNKEDTNTKIETNLLQIKVEPHSSIDFAKEEKPPLIHKKDAINLKLDSAVTASSSKLSTIEESTQSVMNTSIKLKNSCPAAPNSNKLKKTKNSNVTWLENFEHKSIKTLIKTEILDNETKISNLNKNISTSSCTETTKNMLTKCAYINTIPKFSKTTNVVIKSKPNSTMEIVDSQNKVIVLKKVVLKKKPIVKVKNKKDIS